MPEYQGSRNKYHAHGKGTFRIYNGYFKLRDNTTVYTQDKAAYGLFFVSRSNTEAPVESSGTGTGWQYNFDTNNGGNWTGNTGSDGSSGYGSKPPTIAMMWILRFK